MPDLRNGAESRTSSTIGKTAAAEVARALTRLQVEVVPIDTLRASPRNARRHSKKQISQIAASVQAFGFNNPIAVDDAGEIIAGHGRLEAARQLGRTLVPIVRLDHLSDKEKRAYALAENKIALNAGWDAEMLAIELGELGAFLPDVGIDLNALGFSPAELDKIQADLADSPAEAVDETPSVQSVPVSRPNDVWILGRHRLFCGDARDASVFRRLMNGASAQMMFTDPPYNVRINGHVRGGRKGQRHREFLQASGEMDAPEFRRFLRSTLGNAVMCCDDGSIAYVCMDWRHAGDLIEVGRSVFSAQKNLCVWVKTNAGQGSFYRSQHELVFVFKIGDADHRNNFELGQHGRTRTNVWTYAGVNSFRAGRDDDLAMHPTVKPVAMVADAMKDCSRRGDIILDPFSGSGTLFVAAEQVGRRGYGIELDPLYVDVAVRRWQGVTKADAIHEASGQTFDALEAQTTKRSTTGPIHGNDSTRKRARHNKGIR